MVEELTEQEIGRVRYELEKADENERKGALVSVDALIEFLSELGLLVISEKLKEFFEDSVDRIGESLEKIEWSDVIRLLGFG